MNRFDLQSKFKPCGDQPEAIKKLVARLNAGKKHQTLWGVTGSGKTFTVANVVQAVQKPTLVIAHNKTLAAQLADEFREVFPDNAVHYFVSYYDYYQPEAYIPSTDTYIEKDSAINDEIEKLRHAATHSLLTRKDVLIVASVSCIYGLGSPEFYQSENFTLRVGEPFGRDELLRRLIAQQFDRNDIELKRGTFRLKGDTLEIMPAYSDNPVKIEFFGDVVEKISEHNWLKGEIINRFSEFEVYPAKHFITPADVQREALKEIKTDLGRQLKYFRLQGKLLEAERLEQRTNYDIEMIEQTGTCSGIENYCRYFDRRKPGEPPTTLLDYFPPDFLMVIDESHMTVPQIGGMYAGDRSRKEKLVEFGFRLPSAMDNRPLRFDEFYKRINQVIFVSATPGEWELEKSSNGHSYDAHPSTLRDAQDPKSVVRGLRQTLPIDETGVVTDKRFTILEGVVRQFIRPTGLLDPKIEVRQSAGQINDLIGEIEKNVVRGQRVLVTTLTKRMAEELTEYLTEKLVKVAYLHSDIPTLERSEILHSLRIGEYDVLVGINLLREGLDLPEVSLVAILDADKEGFLRSRTSLVQIIGRAARHVEGRVIMYADTITESMRIAIEETEMRRRLQQESNIKNGVSPRSIEKTIKPREEKIERELIEINRAFKGLSKREKQKIVEELSNLMREAADKLEFERAAELRDQVIKLESLF